jgi:hypothetical protein
MQDFGHRRLDPNVTIINASSNTYIQGRVWGGEWFPPPGAAESKGRQNEYYKWRNLISCLEEILNCLAKYMEIQ